MSTAPPISETANDGGSVQLPILQVKRSRATPRRFAVLITVQLLIIAHVVVWLLSRHYGWFGGRTITPIEPSEGMELVKHGVINAGAIFFAITLLATLVLGRWFCGWGCHIVLLQDACYWLMRKIGVRPRPFRSRLLAWFPLALAFYMFLWPVVYRVVFAPWLQPGLHWPGFSTDLVTSNFWSTFAGPVMAAPFLLVCGFASVYVLGAKGFCTYGCPYGGFFAPLEQLSKWRIRVTDDCRGCAHCTAACTSNVRVHEEVRTWGMVTDPGCMKTLDCVSTCPNDALYFGKGPSAIKKQSRGGIMPDRRHDLSVRGEVALGVLFLASFLSYRGIYAAVPMLMAVGMALVTSWTLWKAWCVLRLANASLHRTQLRYHGAMRPAGRLFLAVAAIIAIFAIQCGAVATLRIAGDAQLVAGDSDRALRLLRLSGPIGEGGVGLASDPNVDMTIARLEEARGDLDEAERLLRRVDRRVGPHEIASMRIGQVLQLRGDDAATAAFYADRLAANPTWPLVWEDRIAWLIRSGDAAGAVDASRSGLAANGTALRLLKQGVFVELNLGELARGIGLLEQVVDRVPDDVEAWATLARALQQAGRGAEAAAAADRARQLGATLP